MKTFQEYLNDSSIEAFHIHARSPDFASITFVATDIPSLGWKVFHVRVKESAPIEIKVTPLMRLFAPLAALPIAQKLIARFSQPKTLHHRKRFSVC